jgi:sterol desaturase/sphingolipid hydroxylase (fatty acid hydroxylase superfamily)
MVDLNLQLKQKEFNSAMYKYTNRKIYKLFGKLISIINVSLQIYLLYLLTQIQIGVVWNIIAFLVAFVLTDFVNGIVHMIMDHISDYSSVAGPLIANFHLHHQKPVYKKSNVLLVYFNESGAKVWLAGYLFIVCLLFTFFNPNPVAACVLIYFGILSSIAEVSHYLCHMSDSGLCMFLSKIGVLLSKGHHFKHHLKDNTNYAFLNGCSDPLINLIAGRFCKGYKNTTDRHFARYFGEGSDNR